MADANIRAVITAKDDASKTLKNFGDNVNHTARNVELGLLAAGGAAVAFGVSSIKAFTESQDAIAQTNAVLKSTGSIAGVTAEQVDEIAKSLQKVTKFTDEDVRSVENLLLTFTSIGKDIFPQATKTVLDMATALGEDTKSASIQLGKALQDPINGITALRRVGVNFSDAQKDVIQKLVDTGKTAEAQKMILKELQTEFGGSAEAAGNTFSGSLAKLKNKLDDVQEAVGETLVKGLTPLAAKLADFVSSDKFQKWLQKLIDWFNKEIPIAIQYVTDTLIPELKRVFDELWPVVQKVLGIMQDLFKYMSEHTWVVWALVGAFVALKTAMFLAGAVEAFQGVMAAVSVSYGAFVALLASPLALPAIAIGAALAALWAVKNAALDTYQAIENSKLAAESLGESNRALLKRLQAQTQAPYSPEAQATARATIAKLAAEGQFDQLASGTDYAQGGLTLVGEQGPELVNMPRGAQVIPNDRINSVGGSINLSVNVGIYAGTQMEKRKLAEDLMNAYQDLMRSRGMA